MAVPTVAASSHARTVGTATSLTFSHTVASGTAQGLFVAIDTWSQVSITSVTYGGVSLIPIYTNASGSHRGSWFYLENPTVGTANIVVTPASGAYIAAGAFNVTNIEYGRVFRGGVFAASTSTTPSVTITSSTTDLVLDFLGDTITNGTKTVGAGQTSLFQEDSIANGDVHGSASTEAGGASVTMSWTVSGSTNWGLSAISIPYTGTLSPAALNVSALSVEVFSTQAPATGIDVYHLSVEVFSLSAVPLPVVRSDAVGVADVVQTRMLTAVRPLLSDAVGVADVTARRTITAVRLLATETIGVAESQRPRTGLTVRAAESTSVVTATALSNYISLLAPVFDAIAAADSAATRKVTKQYVTVADAAGATDARTAELLAGKEVHDSAGVTDAVALSTFQPTLRVRVWENVVGADVPKPAITPLLARVLDRVRAVDVLKLPTSSILFARLHDTVRARDMNLNPNSSGGVSPEPSPVTPQPDYWSVGV